MGGAIFVGLLVVFAAWYYLSSAGQTLQADERSRKQAQKQQRAQVAPGVRCPTCTSTNVERVTAATRAASGAAGGILFSKKARAQFHCKGCDYFW